jgi:hypothetical protein
MTMFRIGQKVVCVGTKGTPNIDWDAWCAYWKVVRPTRGLTYTVRDTRIGRDGRQHLHLVEIVNPIAEFIDAPPQEKWFWAEAFRPAVENSTTAGMAVFREILDRESFKERVPEKARG